MGVRRARYRLRLAPVAFPLLVLPFTSISIGVAIVFLSESAVAVTVLLAVACIACVEGARVAAGRRAQWWIAHICTLPWVGIVLVPWFIRLASPNWPVGLQFVDSSLPNTWKLHVLALVGFTVGSCLGIVVHAHLDRGVHLTQTWSEPNWRTTAFLLSAVGAAYLASVVIAGRPLASIWRLGGPFAHGGLAEESGGFPILDRSLDVGVVLMLGVAALRRGVRRSVPIPEAVAMAVLSLLMLGSGRRFWLFTLLLGWILIQRRPLLIPRRRLSRHVFGTVVLVLIVVPTSIYGAVAIQSLRTDQGHRPQESTTNEILKSLDVIGSAELLFERGTYLGGLEGESYRELPSLFLPRRFYPGKPHPAADLLVRTRISESAGYSAPLWSEAGLNFGRTGVVLFGLMFSFAVIAAISLLSRLAGASRYVVQAIGGVWLLVAYSLLSRLTIFQCLLSLGVVVIGIALVRVTSRQSAGPEGASERPATRFVVAAAPSEQRRITCP